MAEEIYELKPATLAGIDGSEQTRIIRVTSRRCLRVYVEPTGTMVMRVVRKLRGSKVFYKLGTYRRRGTKTGLSVKEIHDRYERAMRLLDDGQEPNKVDSVAREAAETAQREAENAWTVTESIELFVHQELTQQIRVDGQWVRNRKSKARRNKRPFQRGELLGYYVAGALRRKLPLRLVLLPLWPSQGGFAGNRRDLRFPPGIHRGPQGEA